MKAKIMKQRTISNLYVIMALAVLMSLCDVQNSPDCLMPLQGQQFRKQSTFAKNLIRVGQGAFSIAKTLVLCTIYLILFN